jgi:hypothetical protein
MRFRKVISEPFVQLHIFNSKRNDDFAQTERAVDLALYMARRVRIAGKDHDHGGRAFQRVGDLVAVIAARFYVAWGDPASDALIFQPGTNRVGDQFVL